MLITKMPIEADVFVANSTFPGKYKQISKFSTTYKYLSNIH